jgi:hypothetical protein
LGCTSVQRRDRRAAAVHSLFADPPLARLTDAPVADLCDSLERLQLRLYAFGKWILV